MLTADTGFVNSTRTGPSLSELHPNISVRPTQNIRLNEHPAFIPSPLSLLSPFSTLKAWNCYIVGSGKALLHHIQSHRIFFDRHYAGSQQIESLGTFLGSQFTRLADRSPSMATGNSIAETAMQGGPVVAKSGRRYYADTIGLSSTTVM